MLFKVQGNKECCLDLAHSRFDYQGYTKISEKLNCLLLWLTFFNMAVLEKNQSS
jgi:hypothetical protein